MDWVKQLNMAIDYIEANLSGEISGKEISRIVGCSIYNFQRMFSYIADKPLSEYIRNRKLTLAAFDVLNTDARIIDIALKYGYESQDSFSRAFRSFHGVLPSKARNETVRLSACPRLSFQITVQGERHMKYQIEQWPAFKIAGFKKRINRDNAFQIVPQIWETAWKDGMINQLIELFHRTDYRPVGILGVAICDALVPSEEMDYFLGVTNHVEKDGCEYVPAPDGMEEITIKSSTWAVFETNGELPESVQRVYKQAYTEWLPNSGYMLEDLPVIESYMLNDRQEVWIAVKQSE